MKLGEIAINIITIGYLFIAVILIILSYNMK
jgi:hypothetical protein